MLTRLGEPIYRQSARNIVSIRINGLQVESVGFQFPLLRQPPPKCLSDCRQRCKPPEQGRIFGSIRLRARCRRRDQAASATNGPASLRAADARWSFASNREFLAVSGRKQASQGGSVGWSLINLEGSMGYCSSRHFPVFPRNRYLIQRNRDRNASEQGSESVGTGILFARPRGQLRQRMSEATVGSSGPCRFERVDLLGPEQRQARVHQRSEGHADRLAAREDRAL